MEARVRQSKVADMLRDLCGQIRATTDDGSRQKLLSVAQHYAFALFNDLEVVYGKPPVSEAMERRTGVPSDPNYFEELPAIEEFLHGVEPLGTPNDKTS